VGCDCFHVVLLFFQAKVMLILETTYLASLFFLGFSE